MHLLNTRTLELETFNNRDPSTLSYAILSHVWESTEDEVRFQDFLSPQARQAVQHKPGYAKILRFCDAVKHQHQYVWVDTACIDKKSSAELSEAINSMYFWYRDAAACYAYLRDVTLPDAFSDNPTAHSLRLSNWHTRGWTLQELIAPTNVVFMDRHWRRIGTKQQLKHQLASITGIHESLLSGATPLNNFCIAQKMSWAANRKLTRPEDVAYSLVGLFEISLDIRYGEGAARAFLRLQQEIVRNSADASIFAWNRLLDDKHPGLLAPSPVFFAGCGETVARAPRSDYESQFFRYENGAIATRLRMRPVGGPAGEVYQAIFEGFKVQGRRSGIFLEKLRDGDQYRRVSWQGRSGVLISEEAWERALRSWRRYQLVRVSVPQKVPSPSRNLKMAKEVDEAMKGRLGKMRLVAFVLAKARMVLWKLGL
jgi:hypothetical protein